MCPPNPSRSLTWVVILLDLTLVCKQELPYLGVTPGYRVAMCGGLETRLLHRCWDFGWS